MGVPELVLPITDWPEEANNLFQRRYDGGFGKKYLQSKRIYGIIKVAVKQFMKHIGSMVKRLRHRPFTAVTRVRFPVGSPPIKYALVAELADAPDLGSGWRPWGFESLQAHQIRSIV